MDKLGNPALIAAAANPQAVNKVLDGTGKVLKVAFFGILTFGAIAGYRYLTKENRAKKTLNKGTAEVAQALQLRAAMERWGAGLLPKIPFITLPKIPDGTNENYLYTLASQIKDWPQVLKDYQAMFDSNLLTDLTAELSNTELQRFFQVLEAGDKNTAEKFYPLGTTVYAIKDGVNVYDTPNWNHIDRQAKRGEEIGQIKKAINVTMSGRVKSGYVVEKCIIGGFICNEYRVWHTDVSANKNLF